MDYFRCSVFMSITTFRAFVISPSVVLSLFRFSDRFQPLVSLTDQFFKGSEFNPVRYRVQLPNLILYSYSFDS